MLEAKKFYLCKRGLLVNFNAIKEIDQFAFVIMSDGKNFKLTEIIGKKYKNKYI